ncbi:MAG TPA: poly(3-hydroxyalkanoate) depolymerase [Nitriliruptoraceae bacterium]|nr:poly(3-hydroxyalkanoate) depolymerase [Nitriliruptoraceae bacterium]
MTPHPTAQLVDIGGQVLRVDHRPSAPGGRVSTAGRDGGGATGGDDHEVPLLLCNGIGANLELWEPFVAALDRPTITFDAPGVGGSSVPLYPPTLKVIAQMVVAMLDRLGVDRVDVLGLSWGGALAQELAHRHSQRVRRLVLAATLAGWTAIPGKPTVLARMVTPRRYRDPEYLNSIAADLYGGEVRNHPDWLREHGHQRFLHQAGTRGYVYQLLAPRRWTSLPWLHTLPQPTLVLAGDDDPIIRMVNPRCMASRIPDATLHVVEGGGHLFLMTRASEMASIVDDFLGAATTSRHPEPT